MTRSEATVKFEIDYRHGDIFADIPDGALLIHACNAKGIWGTGVAKEFKIRYPAAFRKYQTHCDSRPSTALLGTALLILPSLTEGGSRSNKEEKKHLIGCLFTREGYGKPTGKELRSGYQQGIVEATESSMRHLLGGLVASTKNKELEQDIITEIRMPLINSGKFAVPWQHTERVLLDLEVPIELSALQKLVIYER